MKNSTKKLDLMFSGVVATGDHACTFSQEVQANLNNHQGFEESEGSNQPDKGSYQNMNDHARISRTKRKRSVEPKRQRKKTRDVTTTRNKLSKLVTICSNMISGSSISRAPPSISGSIETCMDDSKEELFRKVFLVLAVCFMYGYYEIYICGRRKTSGDTILRNQMAKLVTTCLNMVSRWKACSKMASESSTSRAPSSASVVVKALEEITEIYEDIPLYLYSIDLLMDPNKREMFMSMAAEQKVHYLRSFYENRAG